MKYRFPDIVKRLGRYLVLAVVTPVFVILLLASIATASDRESLVKAAFLLNFARLVDWPGSAFKGHPGTFNVCVPANDPIAEVVSTQQGKNVKGRKVVWELLNGFDSVTDCQVILIPERRRLSQAIKAAGDRPVLLVGEQDGFCQAGGGINLVSTDGRIGFDINLKALQRVDLKAGAQLLKVARDVIQ